MTLRRSVMWALPCAVAPPRDPPRSSALLLKLAHRCQGYQSQQAQIRATAASWRSGARLTEEKKRERQEARRRGGVGRQLKEPCDP
jgi:hypothetical protein